MEIDIRYLKECDVRQVFMRFKEMGLVSDKEAWRTVKELY